MVHLSHSEGMRDLVAIVCSSSSFRASDHPLRALLNSFDVLLVMSNIKLAKASPMLLLYDACSDRKVTDSINNHVKKALFGLFC